MFYLLSKVKVNFRDASVNYWLTTAAPTAVMGLMVFCLCTLGN